MGTSFEAGDHLVLSVPVIRAVENDPWSTVTFALGNGQWVTIPQGAKDIVKVLKGSADAQIEDGRRREHVHEVSIRPAVGGQATVVFRIGSGHQEFEFSGDELARLGGRALAEASRLPTDAAGSLPEPDAALAVSAISVDDHSIDPSSVQLAVQVGKLKLAFDLEAKVLLQAVKHYLDRRKSARSAPSQADSQPLAAPMKGRSLELTGGNG
jgi:hypothetical protein